eukprot:9466656-Pyramimonas_sp.AAC.1
MEFVSIGSGTIAINDSGYYFPSSWRQTERELCRYNASSVAAMQDRGRYCARGPSSCHVFVVRSLSFPFSFLAPPALSFGAASKVALTALLVGVHSLSL